MFYPLKFEPVFKDYIWGGRNLEKLGKKLPLDGKVAESWEISCHPNGTSIIKNGLFAGAPLPKLIATYGRQIMGDALPEKDLKKFPLLIKLIDANEKLSVQVHPDDRFASSHENGESGKNEMWYIISAKPGAKLVYNLMPGVSKEDFIKSIQENTIEKCLRYIEVFAGDTLDIPAGLLHAIGEGIILAEIQQNSDTTYRVYDYHRVDQNGNTRPLHTEKALEVINFHISDRPAKTEGLPVRIDSNSSLQYLVANRYFAVIRYQVKGEIKETADGRRFLIFILTEGEGQIDFRAESLSITCGESVLIPATMGDYTLKGDFTALKTYIPDLEKDIIIPLKKAGYPEAEIYQKVSGLR